MTASPPPARGDKPPRRFPCPECPEWFWSRADLSRHRAANAHARPASPPPTDALREGLDMLDSMVRSGEKHTDHSLLVVRAARAALAAAPAPGLDVELLEAVENVLTSDSLDPDDHLHWTHLRQITRDRRARLAGQEGGG